MKNNGYLAIVHRTDRLIEIITSMKSNNIEPKKIQFIYPKKGQESNLVLIEGIKNGKPGLKILSPLLVHNEDGTYMCDGNNKYTKEIREESYNGGATWYPSYPTVYRQGTFVGVDADYCCDKFIGHYGDPQGSPSCPAWYKWNGFECVYVDPLKVVKCNDNPTLTRDETLYYTSNYELLDGEIGATVSSISAGAFSGYTSLTSITIPNSVTSIGEKAFYNCSSLREVHIPDSVTSIGASAFTNCVSLTSCTIGSGVTSIGDYTFQHCDTLRSIDLPDSVTTIGDNAFQYCRTLTSCTIGTGVTTIGDYAFQECSGITSVNIPTGITSIGDYAFYRCGDLTTITVPSGSIGEGCFSTCISLTSATFGYDVTSIGENVLESCISLKELYIFGGEILGYVGGGQKLKYLRIGSGVTSIGEMAFNGKGGLIDVDIDEGLTTIGAYAFRECLNLPSIKIPNSVTIVGTRAFENCVKLYGVTIGNGLQSFGSVPFNQCNNLNTLTIACTTPPSIGNLGPTYITYKVYVPYGYKTAYQNASGWGSYPNTIYELDSHYCFDNCSYISWQPYYSTRYVCNDDDVYSLKEMHCTCDNFYLFTTGIIKPDQIVSHDCDNVSFTYRWYPSGTTCEGYNKWELSVKQISYDRGTTWYKYVPQETSATTLIEEHSQDCGYVFDGKFEAYYSGGSYFSAACDSNTTLTTGTTRPSGYNASAMTSCTVGSCITSIGGGFKSSAFYNCIRLESIELPNTLTTIGDYAFQRCLRLTSINIPSGVTSIGDGAFSNCSSITSIDIPSGVTAIGTTSFSTCRSLTSITIPDSVTSIGSQAFLGCSGLTSIEIPSSVTSIADWAFSGCSSFNTITVNAIVPPTLGGSVFIGSNCPIYVPAASVNAYKAATNWSDYSNRIIAIQ